MFLPNDLVFKPSNLMEYDRAVSFMFFGHQCLTSLHFFCFLTRLFLLSWARLKSRLSWLDLESSAQMWKEPKDPTGAISGVVPRYDNGDWGLLRNSNWKRETALCIPQVFLFLCSLVSASLFLLLIRHVYVSDTASKMPTLSGLEVNAVWITTDSLVKQLVDVSFLLYDLDHIRNSSNLYY